MSLSDKEERSALWKHCKEKRNNEVQRFQMNVTGLYPSDAMLRQISEGVRIEKVPGDSLINSKNEWNFSKFRARSSCIAARYHQSGTSRDD